MVNNDERLERLLCLQLKEDVLEKMPVLFVAHGSPMNAIEHNAFTETSEGLSARLPREVILTGAVFQAEGKTSGSDR